MKLYTFDPAPNPARLGMFMQYKGITLDTVQIDLGAEEQLGEAYMAIVPEATVPALMLDDGTVAYETAALSLTPLDPPTSPTRTPEGDVVLAAHEPGASTVMGRLPERSQSCV